MDSTEMEFVEKIDDNKLYIWLKNNYMIVVSFIIYSIIFVFGLVGNVLVIYSVMREKFKQTVTNVFMANLALANILLCLFILPLTTLASITKTWVFPFFMCHLRPIIYYSSYYASSLTLASIAVNRYLAIAHQLSQTLKIKKVLIVIAIVWIVAVAMTLPFGILISQQYSVCYLEWPSIITYRYYVLSTFNVLFAIPLLGIACIYIALSIMMSRMSARDPSIQMVEERRANRLLIAMATVFCVCTLPCHMAELLGKIDVGEYADWKYLATAFQVFDVMELMWTCFNPLFYGWLNKSTIKQLCLVGQCCKHQSKFQSNNDDDVDICSQTCIINNEGSADDVTYDPDCDAALPRIAAERTCKDWLRESLYQPIYAEQDDEIAPLKLLH